MRKPKARIYWRDQGGTARAYGDFRDLGGGREALIDDGERRATTDPVIAESLVAKRLATLQERKRDRTLLGVRRRAGLKEYAAEHLLKKKRSGKVTDRHLSDTEHRLSVAVEFFGAGCDLAGVGVEHVQEFVQWLQERENGGGGQLSPSTQRKYLSALSNLFRRAQGEGLIRGVNPVQALMDKPTPQPAEAAFLEVWEGALLLESARTYRYDENSGDTRAGARLRNALREVLGAGPESEAVFLERMRAAGRVANFESLRAYFSGERIPARDYLITAAEVLGIPTSRLVLGRGTIVAPIARPERFLYALLGTFLLTGGRRAEVFGLELGDVIQKRGVVAFRPNQRRRLKTKTSKRTVPLWPQLREILEPYIERRREQGAGDSDLLFPSPYGGGLLDNIDKALDRVAERAGWKCGEVRTKAFRHAYCTARLQTLDRGFPVSEFVVAREMGHGGHELVRRVYGHLGEIRHRSEAVEYRIEQQRDAIPPERLRLLLRIA